MASELTIRLRNIKKRDWPEIADLICVSTNYWYQVSGKPPVFPGGPTATRLFCEVYETLDTGCCVVAEETQTSHLAGSCFYHPRPTHLSLGIMNVHPNYFGHGVAARLLKFITDIADSQAKSIRLVSSAINLDSFSLYTRAGFVPRCVFQDMVLPVPVQGPRHSPPGLDRVRPASLQDIPAMVALEQEIAHIHREKDFHFFIDNAQGIWHTSVLEGANGRLDGFLVSVAHPGSNRLGPGIMRTADAAAALILAELDHRRAGQPHFLVPADCTELIQKLYALGARNCELNLYQVRGHFDEFGGVVMPTFMPETG